MELTVYPLRVARRALELTGSGVFADGFIQRAAAAALPALPTSRDIRNPHYLTDLGVREFKDPGVFFEAHLALNPELHAERPDDDLGRTLDGWCRAWVCGDVPVSRLSALFEVLIGFQGDWDAALHVAAFVAAHREGPVDHTLAVYAATTLAARADPLALPMFDTAARLAPTDADHFMVLVRKATYEFKRNRSIAGGNAVLDLAVELLDRWRRDNLLSPGDREVLHAVSGNLRALSHAMRKDWAGALQLLEHARAEIDAEGLVVVDTDARGRYRAQIRINLAQTHWLRGDTEAALRVIEEHAELIVDDHPYSVSEALAIASYMNYRTGRYPRALTLGRRAERILRGEASPVRLASCRKTLIGALHRSGQSSLAERGCGLAARDPLGLEELVGDSLAGSEPVVAGVGASCAE